ncbi:TPA: hypothetical protein ACS52O_004752 [Salmonella enterica]
MNFITDLVLDAIEGERPEMADWCEDKRHELPDNGKLEALRWVVSLDTPNKKIAARALGIQYSDLEPLERILQVI